VTDHPADHRPTGQTDAQLQRKAPPPTCVVQGTKHAAGEFHGGLRVVPGPMAGMPSAATTVR
jgi:hypothetical protein